jgi:hypothetical protein
VEENRRIELEEELKKMIDNSSQKQEKKEQRKIRNGTGNVIRRRAGEKDKRFSA